MQVVDLHPTLSVGWQREGDLLRVVLTGELDLVTGDRLRRWFRNATGPAPVQVDLGSVSFCDAAGMRALHRLAAASIGLRFVNVPELVGRVAELCAVDLRAADEPAAPIERAPVVGPHRKPRPFGNGHRTQS
ncbi:MAG: STAS domain-containing protein [Acidimicrobiia bacterium]